VISPIVQVRVQHHPARADHLSPLLDRLDGLDVEVVTDPDPSGEVATWRTYRECLRDIPPECESLVVLQDDTVPCRGFADQLSEALIERPLDLVSLYTGLFPELTAIRARQAYSVGDRWSRHQGSWVPAVALAWPVVLAEDAVEWCDGVEHWPLGYPDDARLGHWQRERRLDVWHRLPNLVDHPGHLPSIVGTKQGSHWCSVVPGDEPQSRF
jgi:hypothetical protein